MSGLDTDALAALLRRWPISCALGRELVIADAGHWFTAPVAVVVSSGPIWVRRGEAPVQRLTTGDVLVVHDTASVGVFASPVTEQALADEWSPSPDPLTPAAVIGIDLATEGRQVNARLLPAPFQVSSTAAEPGGYLATLVSGVIATARSTAIRPVADATATALYLECLHRHLRSLPKDVGWLTGLFDAEVGPIVAAMLEAPARDWTVESLAEVGGMSRSAFARKFRDLMGAAPIDFLVEVRMWQAARQLKQPSTDLKTISREAGYQSPAAFSVAFKRWSGATPSDYRRAP